MSNTNSKSYEKSRKPHQAEHISQEQFFRKPKLNGVQSRNRTMQTNSDRILHESNLLPVQTRPGKVPFPNSSHLKQPSKYENHQPSRMYSNLSDLKGERETSRLSFISKTDSIQSKQKINDKHFPVQSPTSWSVISKHQTNRMDSPRTPSFHERIYREDSNASSKTYRVRNDQQQQSSSNK